MDLKSGLCKPELDSGSQGANDHGSSDRNAFNNLRPRDRLAFHGGIGVQID